MNVNYLKYVVLAYVECTHVENTAVSSSTSLA